MSVTIPCTQTPIVMSLSILPLIISASHCTLNMTSGIDRTMKDMDSLKPTTISAAIPLNIFPFFSIPTHSPAWYNG